VIQLRRRLRDGVRPLLVAIALLAVLVPRSADAQSLPRDVAFEWDYPQRLLHVSVKYRDVIDADTDRKLSSGVPTTLVFTAAVYRVGVRDPVSTTAQTCEITLNVWKEIFRVKIMRPGSVVTTPVTTKDGVLRRCAEANLLLAGDRTQVPPGVPLYLVAKVQVNPVSPTMLQQIKRWVSRPTGTATAAPADALFSTFTGLFVQRIADAARELDFTTRAMVPTVAPPPPPPPAPPPTAPHK